MLLFPQLLPKLVLCGWHQQLHCFLYGFRTTDVGQFHSVAGYQLPWSSIMQYLLWQCNPGCWVQVTWVKVRRCL